MQSGKELKPVRQVEGRLPSKLAALQPLKLETASLKPNTPTSPTFNCVIEYIHLSHGGDIKRRQCGSGGASTEDLQGVGSPLPITNLHAFQASPILYYCTSIKSGGLKGGRLKM